MRHAKIVIIIFGLITTLNSQSYFKKYSNFPGGSESISNIIKIDSLLSIIISSGEIENLETWQITNRIIKNQNGEQVNKSYMELNKNFSYSTQSTILNNKNNLIGVGTSSISNSLIWDYDIFLFEMDKSANVIWSKSIGDSFVKESSKTVIQTDDGGYLIGGWRYKSPTSNLQEAFLLKTSSTGDSLWMRFYTQPELSNHTEGKVLVNGENNTCYYFYKTDYSFNYAKIDANTGDIIWNKSYPVEGIQRSAVFSVLTNVDGSLIATGVFSDQDREVCSPAVWEIDQDGKILAEHLYNGQLPCLFDDDLLRTRDGDYAIVYRDGQHPRIVVYDQNFNIKFTKLYEIEDYMFPVGFIQADDGSFMIAGAEGATSDYTIWLLRTDINGDLVSVTGPNINENRIQVYPNPTSDIIHIKGELPEDAKVNIIDENGKIIGFYSNVNTINFSNKPRGAYFINVFDKDKLIINKKVIKI
jgi:hypothetical protein